ncbi:unnamed protein product [Mytilus coruscus]|uniref:MACPF domain-containing protein n=1 Tax=Mytilus coruscus TaxID=42192 RepID=A0A6J8EJ11_MYTCO|nr:unnamed protein product [Mytilus coruscus]
MEFDDKSYLRDFDMERVKRIIQKVPSGGQIVTRKPLQSYDLIRQIAAGQLLRGQFIHENLQKSSSYRKQLIQVDEPIELMSPGISETMEILEFDDKKQSDEFDSVLNQCGVSFALGFCGRIPLVAHGVGQGSVDYTHTSQKKTMMDWQEQFVKMNQILIVPTASFTLSNHSVCLFDCALDALTCLHRKFIRNDSSFEKHCNFFFNEFGSHFYTGVWHFGENYQKAKFALSGSVGGGYLWFGGEVKGAFENDKEQVTGTQTFSEKFKVAKKLEKFGGPQEVDDISLWKKGLEEYNNTWVIIDKDVSQRCYEGVWTLLQGQESMFSNAKDFSKKIQGVWEEIYQKAKTGAMSWSKHQIYFDKNQESNSTVELVKRRNLRKGTDEYTRKQVDYLLSTTQGNREFADEYSRKGKYSQEVLHQKYEQYRDESNK